MPQNGENAYLVIKNPRASRVLRLALDPGQLGLSSFMRLHCTKLAKRSKIFSFDLPLYKKLATACRLQKVMERNQIQARQIEALEEENINLRSDMDLLKGIVHKQSN